MNWKIPSPLLFHHSCLYNEDVWCVWSWQLEAPGPSTKAKTFNAAVWEKKKCCEKICTVENVFLMCFCERLSACHVSLQCFQAPQKKPFLHLAIGVKLADCYTVKRNTLVSGRIFSKVERLCNCQQYRAKNIINFWIHLGTDKLSQHTMVSSFSLDVNMCTHKNPLNHTHENITYTRIDRYSLPSVFCAHTTRQWLYLHIVHLVGFQTGRVCKPASCLPLITSQAIIGGCSNYFLFPLGKLGGYKLKMIPTHDLDFPLQSNYPLSSVTAYHCAIILSEKIVCPTLTPPSPQILAIYHHDVLSISKLWQTPGLVGQDWYSFPPVSQKMLLRARISSLKWTIVAL